MRIRTLLALSLLAPLFIGKRQQVTQPLSAAASAQLSNLHPDAQPHFRALLETWGGSIASAKRSEADQNALYAQGRTAPGPIVTNARGCMSWHVQGRAIDLSGLDDATLRQAGAWWKERGGKWGGDFPGLYDPVHFEWHPGLRIEDVCRL